MLCHSRSEALGVTWEHRTLPDIMKIQIQHDNSLKTWEGRDGTVVNQLLESVINRSVLMVCKSGNKGAGFWSKGWDQGS